MTEVSKECAEVRTWIEIDKKALQKNYDQFRKIIDKKCQLMAIVKSNAYGHGIRGYSESLDKIGVDWFGVDSFLEARTLRDHGIKKPILVLGYTLPCHFAEAIEKNISLTISNFDSINALEEIKSDQCLKIHLKIDTGMHRQGFMLAELDETLGVFKDNKNLCLEGVYSHFAAAKNPAFPTETKKQLAVFKQALTKINQAGFSPLRHIAATGGTIIFPESHFDMVRIGIGLMGLWPSDETKSAFEQDFSLTPALTWKTLVSEIKTVKKGEGIGYNLIEKPRQDIRIAILPVGYWHGYRRALSSVGHVLIGGKRCRVLGMVSMDMVTVDVSAVADVKIGDTVILLGRDSKEIVPAEELALYSGTCNYEIITQLNPLIQRLYL